MPSQRFYNLPEEKRKRIAEAAITELSNYSVDDLSINRIIKLAEIPRGSFYEYFKDKFDLVDYLLEDFKTNIQFFAKKCIEKDKCDIFELFEKIFCYMIKIGFKDKSIQFFKNIFSCLKYAEYHNYDFLFLKRNEIINEYFPLLDLKKYRIKTKQDLLYLLEMVLDVFKSEISNAFIEGKNFDKHITTFSKKMNILRNGVLDS